MKKSSRSLNEKLKLMNGAASACQEREKHYVFFGVYFFDGLDNSR